MVPDDYQFRPGELVWVCWNRNSLDTDPEHPDYELCKYDFMYADGGVRLVSVDEKFGGAGYMFLPRKADPPYYSSYGLLELATSSMLAQQAGS